MNIYSAVSINKSKKWEFYKPFTIKIEINIKMVELTVK